MERETSGSAIQERAVGQNTALTRGFSSPDKVSATQLPERIDDDSVTTPS